MTTTRRIIKNASVVFLGDNVFKVLTVILILFIARYLGVEEYGKFSFIISFTGLFFILMDLGTRILIVREISQNKQNASRIISNVFILKLFTSAIFYVIIIAVSIFLDYDKEIIYGIAIAALGIIFDSLAVTVGSVFQAFERMEFPAYVKMGRILLRFAATMPFLFAEQGFLPVLIIFVIMQFLNFLVCLLLSFKFFVKPVFDFDKKLIIYLIKKSFPFLLSGVFVTIYFRIDITLMSKIAPQIFEGIYSNASREAVIGWYSAAYNILDGFISIPTAISAAILPVAITYFSESKEKLKRIYTLSVKYLSYLSFPIAIGTTIIARSLILLVYNEEYLNSVLALQLLVWTIVPLFINYMLGCVMIAIQREKEGMYILMGNAIINIILNLILIPKFSLYGAAVATLLTELFYFSGYYYVISKHVGSINLFSILIKPFTASILMGVGLYFIREINMFFLILIGAFTYLILMWAMKAFSEEDITLLKKIFKAKT